MKPLVIPEDRPLSAEERTLIEWLIANGIPDAKEYAAQIDETRVVGTCECGCPTVDLSTAGARASNNSHILSDHLGESPEGLEVGVLLFAKEGKLSCLEIYSLAGNEGSFSLPKIETLRPF